MAKEVCDLLSLSHTGMAVKSLDVQEKSYVDRIHLGMNPGKQMVIVNEPGLYRLVMRSNKPEAVKFQMRKKQSRSERLRSERKGGVYFTHPWKAPSVKRTVVQSQRKTETPC